MTQEKSYTVTALEQLSVEQVVALFKTLEAPTIVEMNGEYAAKLLQQPSKFATIAGGFSVKNPLMPWRCKAFRPVDQSNGRGYNTFDLLGKTIQRFPMQTVIAASRYDGKPAYQLVYHAYHSLCGDIHMVDEVRRLAADLYLGIGTWGFMDSQRMIPLPFVLQGPIAAYRGDIGKARQRFDLKREIPALKP